MEFNLGGFKMDNVAGSCATSMDNQEFIKRHNGCSAMNGITQSAQFEVHSGDEQQLNVGSESEEYLEILKILNNIEVIVGRNRNEAVRENVARNREKLKKYSHAMRERIRRDLPVEETPYFRVKKLYPANFGMGLADPSVLPTGSSKSLKEIETLLPVPPKQHVPPPYTTWIFANRNKRMIEDQSVENKRRIYYDENRKETVIASDSEDELRSLSLADAHQHVAMDETVELSDTYMQRHEAMDLEREFNLNEDFLIWMAAKDYGVSDNLFEQISDMIDREREKVKERYTSIMADDELIWRLAQIGNVIFNKQIVEDAKSSFIKDTADLQQAYLELTKRVDRLSVHEHILHPYSIRYLTRHYNQDNANVGHSGSGKSSRGEGSQLQAIDEEKTLTGNEDYEDMVAAMDSYNFGEEKDAIEKTAHTRYEKGKIPEGKIDLMAAMSSYDNLFCRMCLRFDCELHGCSQPLVLPNKMQTPEPRIYGPVQPCGAHCYLLMKETKMRDESLNKARMEEEVTNMETLRKADFNDHEMEEAVQSGKPENVEKTLFRSPANETWTTLEMDLFDKGLQIFGKSSCLIAQNLLKGCKTCAEVENRIATQEAKASTNHEDGSAAGRDAIQRPRPKNLKKKGGRKIRFSLSSQKNLGKLIGQNFRNQFYPCSCSVKCGDDCICMERKTPCEKYCGCPSRCKNRFSGCHCAKSQCRNKQCPCFVAGRECDPDVCRFCSLECGDVVPEDVSVIPASGPSSEAIAVPGGKQSKCQNMRILLDQKKSVLLARSDVSGWGLFLKDAANKNDYLGEYTGELISQREADKRGKIYDIVNLSFLFDLNDRFVIDAYRIGSKFKFANHSSTPNCYPKVVKVVGEHRVGMFAKTRIEAGEELFFDYRYEKKLGERTPWWAKNKKKVTTGTGSSISSPRQKTMYKTT